MVTQVVGWGAFGYYRSLTVDHTKVSTTDQSNFPILVSGTYSYLATEANGGKVKNSSGYDIGFYSNADCSTGKLDWETVLYTGTTGAVNYRVRIPTLSSSSDTVIYLCYADAGISTDQSNKTGVWDSNYRGVWHLPDGSTLTATDSTTYGRNGTITGATATTGPTYLDGAANIANTSQYIDFTGLTIANAQAATISAWVYNASHTAIHTVIGGACNSLSLRINTSANIVAGKTGIVDFTASTGTIADSTWTQVAFSWDGAGNFAYYINGAASGTGSTAQNPTTGTSRLGGSACYSESLAGSIDEVKISFSQRSAGWIATEYNSESNPTTFYTVGAQSTPSAGTTKVSRGQII